MGNDWEEILGADGDDIQQAYDDKVGEAVAKEALEEQIRMNEEKRREEEEKRREEQEREEKRKREKEERRKQLLTDPANIELLREANRFTLSHILNGEESNEKSLEAFIKEKYGETEDILDDLGFSVSFAFEDAKKRQFCFEIFDGSSYHIYDELKYIFGRNNPFFFPLENPFFNNYRFGNFVEIKLANGTHLFLPVSCEEKLGCDQHRIYAVSGVDKREELVYHNKEKGYYQYYFEINTNIISIETRYIEIIIVAEYLLNNSDGTDCNNTFFVKKIKQPDYCNGELQLRFVPKALKERNPINNDGFMKFMSFNERFMQFLGIYMKKIECTAWVDESWNSNAISTDVNMQQLFNYTGGQKFEIPSLKDYYKYVRLEYCRELYYEFYESDHDEYTDKLMKGIVDSDISHIEEVIVYLEEGTEEQRFDPEREEYIEFIWEDKEAFLNYYKYVYGLRTEEDEKFYEIMINSK